MKRDEEAIDSVVTTWRRTNHTPGGKKHKEPKIAPAQKARRDRLEEIKYRLSHRDEDLL